ncbi:bifunctional 3-(3-hydroxy-phenyl)propionate/3-hydroxycinnamic acid hydroxylase MhpA [Rhizobium alvei]|uniref:Bifunctional 3-(3-hydroxy-phenyl)propionate/3-hydroxycinnamic acid hydroxylase n=1 Tax=Rhizobium alvei TaxID=1132659 RepID=A0ABT8YU99_9HYPH|nr:bifunctional 3-(3-hydroxy-phenyl)propionate/3-hydroxycinnamic acid hydroxylase [Rhizobium alvei]MDO6966730.1 bifunctional 3-(3-hydroxy-phenyl)propionate/3-hydroxycinnamic acid hydroxylase [Rhizobium alvei]
MQNESNDHFDVLVIGFGPAGAVAAGMLGKLGHRTLVIDRLTGIYDKPRAIALDHEIMRHFDNMGIAEAIMPHVAPFSTSRHFGAEGQLIRQIDMVPEPYPLGYTPSMVFTQPPVEAIMRRHAESFDCIEIETGCELVDMAFDDHGVRAQIRTADGTMRHVTADYLIGCDGASSTVRQLAGIRLEDLVFDEPWLVVDVLVNDQAFSKVPQTSAQFCDPARPTSFVIGPGNHRRWEIMLLPEEDPREMERPDKVWALLSPWLEPQDGELWRAAAYRFHALVAETWRAGRIFIAGDAAHQQPPFIGQGMCQGLRDVANLVWKLDRVIKGQSPDSLLDSYGTERKRHVQELTGRIKGIGEMICIRDPAKAAERDARILTDGGGKPKTITRQEIVPPLQEGLIDAESPPASGSLFPQPAVRTDDGLVLLDKIAGSGWRLFVDGRLPHASVDTQSAASIGLSVFSIAPSTVTGNDEILIEEHGILASWFDHHHVCAVIVRPDHYVYGTARQPDEIEQKIAELRRRLS